MFTEHAVGFIPKHMLPLGKRLRDCIDNDKARETMSCIIDCCKYIIDNQEFLKPTKKAFNDILDDIEGYAEYTKDRSIDDEELFSNINLSLEDFYEACDMFKIKICN